MRSLALCTCAARFKNCLPPNVRFDLNIFIYVTRLELIATLVFENVHSSLSRASLAALTIVANCGTIGTIRKISN